MEHRGFVAISNAEFEALVRRSERLGVLERMLRECEYITGDMVRIVIGMKVDSFKDSEYSRKGE